MSDLSDTSDLYRSGVPVRCPCGSTQDRLFVGARKGGEMVRFILARSEVLRDFCRECRNGKRKDAAGVGQV